jgi:hypothetical protein
VSLLEFLLTSTLPLLTQAAASSKQPIADTSNTLGTVKLYGDSLDVTAEAGIFPGFP